MRIVDWNHHNRFFKLMLSLRQPLNTLEIYIFRTFAICDLMECIFYTSRIYEQENFSAQFGSRSVSVGVVIRVKWKNHSGAVAFHS